MQFKFVDKIEEEIPHENNNAHDIEEYFQQNELLFDSATRRDYFEQLDSNDFLDLVQQTANLVRTGNSNAQQSFDGMTVGLMFHEVPDQREKQALLEKVWDVANEILHDRSLSDERALEYAGLTVAGGLLLSHPFADGNGRTSRIVSYVMIRGTNHKGELEDIVGESSSAGGWSVVPIDGLHLSYGREFTGSQPKNINWESQFAGEAEDAYGGNIADSVYKDAIIRRFIEDADDETQAIITAASTSMEDSSSYELDGDKLLKLLAQSDGATDYAGLLYANLRSERARKVEQFLDFMKKDIDWDIDEVEHSVKRKDRRSGDMSDHAKRAQSALAEHAIKGGKLPIRAQRAIMHKAYSRIYDHSDNEGTDVA